jgi:hypothetical protein
MTLFRAKSLRFDSTSAMGVSRSFDASGSCRSLNVDYLGALEFGANDRSAGLFDYQSNSGQLRNIHLNPATPRLWARKARSCLSLHFGLLANVPKRDGCHECRYLNFGKTNYLSVGK